MTLDAIPERFEEAAHGHKVVVDSQPLPLACQQLLTALVQGLRLALGGHKLRLGLLLVDSTALVEVDDLSPLVLLTGDLP